MFCKKCGASLLGNEKFCGVCGAKVEMADEVIETAAPTGEVKEEPVKVTEEVYEETKAEEPIVSQTALEPEPTPFQQPFHAPMQPEAMPFQEPVYSPTKPEPTPFQQPVYTDPQTAAPTDSVNTTLWIVLCAIETVLCCSVLPGAVGLVLAIVAATKKKNDPAGARSMIKGAKIAFWIGVVLSVLTVILTVLFTILGTSSLITLAEESILDPTLEEFLWELA